MRKEYEGSIAELGNLAAGGVRIRAAMIEGDADFGAVISGQVCGRVDDMPSVAELIDRIVAEAHSVADSILEEARS